MFTLCDVGTRCLTPSRHLREVALNFARMALAEDGDEAEILQYDVTQTLTLALMITVLYANIVPLPLDDVVGLRFPKRKSRSTVVHGTDNY